MLKVCGDRSISEFAHSQATVNLLHPCKRQHRRQRSRKHDKPVESQQQYQDSFAAIHFIPPQPKLARCRPRRSPHGQHLGGNKPDNPRRTLDFRPLRGPTESQSARHKNRRRSWTPQSVVVVFCVSWPLRKLFPKARYGSYVVDLELVQGRVRQTQPPASFTR